MPNTMCTHFLKNDSESVHISQGRNTAYALKASIFGLPIRAHITCIRPPTSLTGRQRYRDDVSRDALYSGFAGTLHETSRRFGGWPTLWCWDTCLFHTVHPCGTHGHQYYHNYSPRNASLRTERWTSSNVLHTSGP